MAAGYAASCAADSGNATARAPCQPGANTDPDDDDAYSVTADECDAKARVVYDSKVNGLVIGRMVVGGVGVLLCGLAMMHIYGHGRHKRSLAVRLQLGMLAFNFIFAVADVTPHNLRHLSGEHCGSAVLSDGRHADIAGQCLPDTVSFLGVYGTTMYELMMVLVSVHTLRTDRSDVPPRHERGLHLLCVGAGVAAATGYFVRCRDLNREMAAILADANYEASARNWPGATRYDQLLGAAADLPGVLWGWALAPVALALVCWAYQRVLYRALLKAWKGAAAQNTAFAASDLLAVIGLDPDSDTRARLLQLRRRGYEEVVKPLEPYVIIIFLFAMPQIVALSRACVDQTEAAVDISITLALNQATSHADRPCLYVVELVMAWRAVALAAVYLLPDPQTRAEAFSVPELCRRVWARLSAVVAASCSRRSALAGGGVRFPDNEINGIALVPLEQNAGRSSSFRKADRDIERMGSMASRNLTSLDLAAATVAHEAGDQTHRATMDPADSQIPYQLMD